MTYREIFIEKAQKAHDNKYVYDKVEYVGSRVKVAITCPTHDIFFQEPASHLRGRGCPKCNSKRKSTTLEFIEKVKKIHQDTYLYDDVDYVDCDTPISIKCKYHGNFYQRPRDHLKGSGCRKCHTEKVKHTTEDFIRISTETHGNVYNYDKVQYTRSDEKVTITCKEHGDFIQVAHAHMEGSGCSKCGNKGTPMTKEEFVKKANIVHDSLFTYDKVVYKDSKTKVTITCNTHGDYEQTPNIHLCGSNCPKCGRETHWKRSDYIKKAKGRICTFYTLRCFNENEEFYKIGITMKDIKTRYNTVSKMPYNSEIISEIYGEAGFIWDLEKEEKRKLKEFHYSPTKRFDGAKTECFTQYNLYDKFRSH